MNKDIVTKEIQSIDSNNILLELPTSFGKTKQALDLMNIRKPESVLILVPRVVLKANWKDEFIKWGYEEYLDKVTFSTYVGIKKYIGQFFDLIIADECHHFTDKSLDYLHSITFKYSILLSATVGKFKDTLKYNFKELYCYQVTTKEAMDSNILPDPKVYLIPYRLNSTERNRVLNVKHSNKGKTVTCPYEHRWKFIKDKSYGTINLICTELEYITELSSKIDYWKRMYMRGRNEAIKNKWLYLSGVRLKALGEFKNPIIKTLQVSLRNYRSLTFCNSIEQTEILGKNCINSKNKDSVNILEKFNKKEIKHITSCNMLNEGRQTCPYLSNSVKVN